MNYIDAHCHLADPRFDDCRLSILERAAEAGVHRFVQGGVDPSDWHRQLELADDHWLLSFGLHPWFVNQTSTEICHRAFKTLQTMLPQAHALGELGLDYGPKMDAARFQQQREWFTEQLQIASAMDMPIILHVVHAHGHALEILQSFKQSWRGMVHGFTGSHEVAQAYLKLGLHISIGGAVARPGYKKLKSALGAIPSERLLVESDAPDMPPVGYDRPHNEPETLHHVARALGAFRNQDPVSILLQSRDNLCDIFCLEHST